MNKTLTKDQVKKLLKDSGSNLAKYADYIEINRQSLSVRLMQGSLSIESSLAVKQFAADSSVSDTDKLVRQAVSSNDKTVQSLLDALRTALDEADRKE